MERESGFPFVPVEVRVTTPLAETQDNGGDGEWALDSQSATVSRTTCHKLIFYTVDQSLNLLTEYNEFATRAMRKPATCRTVRATRSIRCSRIPNTPVLPLLPQIAAPIRPICKPRRKVSRVRVDRR